MPPIFDKVRARAARDKASVNIRMLQLATTDSHYVTAAVLAYCQDLALTDPQAALRATSKLVRAFEQLTTVAMLIANEAHFTTKPTAKLDPPDVYIRKYTRISRS